MSEAKFTKGPWVADIRGDSCAVYPKSTICEHYHGMHLDDERNIYYSSKQAKYNGHHWEMSAEAIANAYLISAAPEMHNQIEIEIKFLSHLVSAFQVNSPNSLRVCERIESLKEMLAKARGES